MSDNLKKSIDAEIASGESAESIVRKLRNHAGLSQTAQKLVDEIETYLNARKVGKSCN